MPSPFRLYPPTLKSAAIAFAAVALVALAAPAMASAEPRTRLVDCEAQSCLLITGHRANPAAVVTVNGHAVPVQGTHKWRVRVPLDTVREWSAPFARTITVSVIDAKTQTGTTAKADLPIGLLGHADNLAVLVITAK